MKNNKCREESPLILVVSKDLRLIFFILLSVVHWWLVSQLITSIVFVP